MMDSLLFITPLYAGFFGILLVILSWRVVKLRRKYEGNKMRDTGHNELTAAVRAQGNILEYMPVSLLLMWMLETMQFSGWIVHMLGLLLTTARLMHLHGLNEPSGSGLTRKLGTRLTWLQIVIASLLSVCGAFGYMF